MSAPPRGDRARLPGTDIGCSGAYRHDAQRGVAVRASDRDAVRRRTRVL